MLSLSLALAIAAQPQDANESFKVFVDSIAHPPYVTACSKILSKYPGMAELLEAELKSWQERHKLEIEAGSNIATEKGFAPDSNAFEMTQAAAARGAEELQHKSFPEQAEYCETLIQELRE